MECFFPPSWFYKCRFYSLQNSFFFFTLFFTTLSLFSILLLLPLSFLLFHPLLIFFVFFVDVRCGDHTMLSYLTPDQQATVAGGGLWIVDPLDSTKNVARSQIWKHRVITTTYIYNKDKKKRNGWKSKKDRGNNKRIEKRVRVVKKRVKKKRKNFAKSKSGIYKIKRAERHSPFILFPLSYRCLEWEDWR